MFINALFVYFKQVNNGASKREVTEEEAQQFGAEHNMFTVETSAKTGSNVELAFSAITQEVCITAFTKYYLLKTTND